MSVELKNVLRIEDSTGNVYYLGTLSPHEIKQLTFVPVVTPRVMTGPEWEYLNERQGGYQRAGDVDRMKKIEGFVKKRPDCIIPPVLLSARGKWTFKPSSHNKAFGSIEATDLAAIIDGQHRLGGLLRLVVNKEVDDSIKDRPVPFMAIHEMTEDEEKQEFVDINDNQKGVKKSLLVYLNRETRFSGMAATALSEDEESPFKNRIDIQKKHDWTILLFGAMAECVDLMFSKDFTRITGFNPHQDGSVRESALEFVLQYWRTVRDSMAPYWADYDLLPPVNVKRSKERPGTGAFKFRLLEETGIRAFSKLGGSLMAKTWIDAIQSPSWELVEKYLSGLAESERVRKVLTKPKLDPTVLDLDPELKSTGKAGVEAIHRHLDNELARVMQHKLVHPE